MMGQKIELQLDWHINAAKAAICLVLVICVSRPNGP